MSEQDDRVLCAIWEKTRGQEGVRTAICKKKKNEAESITLVLDRRVHIRILPPFLTYYNIQVN